MAEDQQTNAITSVLSISKLIGDLSSFEDLKTVSLVIPPPVHLLNDTLDNICLEDLETDRSREIDTFRSFLLWPSAFSTLLRRRSTKLQELAETYIRNMTSKKPPATTTAEVVPSLAVAPSSVQAAALLGDAPGGKTLALWLARRPPPFCSELILPPVGLECVFRTASAGEYAPTEEGPLLDTLVAAAVGTPVPLATSGTARLPWFQLPTEDARSLASALVHDLLLRFVALSRLLAPPPPPPLATATAPPSARELPPYPGAALEQRGSLTRGQRRFARVLARLVRCLANTTVAAAAASPPAPSGALEWAAEHLAILAAAACAACDEGVANSGGREGNTGDVTAGTAEDEATSGDASAVEESAPLAPLVGAFLDAACALETVRRQNDAGCPGAGEGGSDAGAAADEAALLADAGRSLAAAEARVLESAHPYFPNSDDVQTAAFPGARLLTLEWDQQCCTQQKSALCPPSLSPHRTPSCRSVLCPLWFLGSLFLL